MLHSGPEVQNVSNRCSETDMNLHIQIIHSIGMLIVILSAKGITITPQTYRTRTTISSQIVAAPYFFKVSKKHFYVVI